MNNVIDFVTINKSIMAYTLLRTNLEQFLGGIKAHLQVNSAKYTRANCPKLASFKPP